MHEMNPTWQSEDGRVQLWHGDCLKVMSALGEVDAVVTDPPYGMNLGRISGTQRSKACSALDSYTVIGDEEPFNPSPWLSFSQVVMWGANHYANKLPAARCWLVWDKRNGGTSDDQADCELAWTNLKGPERLLSHKWRGMIKDSERDQRRVHPTQKPVILMQWCIGFIRGDVNIEPIPTILDPYMGSGTTGIACIRTGRRFIGIEIDERYFKIAKERIENELRQRLLPLA